MKLIDLLNKIANGEKIPNKIKFHYSIWILKRKYSYCEDYSNGKCYLFGDKWALTNNLNDEVEILDENNKIEKLSYKYINTFGNVSQHRKSEGPIIDKINKLIDEVNKLKENI